MTVGEALAEARTGAGLSVAEISERTRIRESVILGIEGDDYDACGGDLFVRGYVRVIADAVGIDAQPLINLYDETHSGSSTWYRVPSAADGSESGSVSGAEPGFDDGAKFEDIVPSETGPHTQLDLPVTASGTGETAADAAAEPSDTPQGEVAPPAGEPEVPGALDALDAPEDAPEVAPGDVTQVDAPKAAPGDATQVDAPKVDTSQADAPQVVPEDVTGLDAPRPAGRKADLADTADDIPVIRLDDTVSDIEPVPADPDVAEPSALSSGPGSDSGSGTGAAPVAADPSADTVAVDPGADAAGAGSGADTVAVGSDADTVAVDPGAGTAGAGSGADAADAGSGTEPVEVGSGAGPVAVSSAAELVSTDSDAFPVSPYARTKPISPGAGTSPVPGAGDMPWVKRGSRRRRGDRGRRRMIGIGALVVVVLAAIGTGVALASGGGGKTPAVAASSSPAINLATGGAGKGGGLAGASASSQPTAKASPKVSPSAKPHKASKPAKPSRPAIPVRTLTVPLAEAFGPDGTSDGDNPQSAMNVVTSSSTHPWSTDWYTSAQFGMLKQGTGLLLDMGSTVTITNVQVDLGPDIGANVQVLAGNEPSLSDMHLAASVNGAGGATNFRLRSPRSARYVLVWFTKLPPSNTGQYQASVYSIAVIGRR